MHFGSETYAEYAARLGIGAADANDDGDRWDNGIEHLFGMDATTPDAPPVQIVGDTQFSSGAYLNTFGASLDSGLDYRVVSYRVPKDLQGSTVTVGATQNLSDFADGSAQATQFLTTDEGDYELRFYYITPDRGTAPRLFWRLEVTP